MYFIGGYYEKCNTAITVGDDCGKHLNMKESFVARAPFKKCRHACSVYCAGSLVHMGSLSVCFSAPKTDMYCSAAALVLLKRYCTLSELFLRRHGHGNLLKRLLLSHSLCFQKGQRLSECPCNFAVFSKSMAFGWQNICCMYTICCIFFFYLNLLQRIRNIEFGIITVCLCQTYLKMDQLNNNKKQHYMYVRFYNFI